MPQINLTPESVEFLAEKKINLPIEIGQRGLAERLFTEMANDKETPITIQLDETFLKGAWASAVIDLFGIYWNAKKQVDGFCFIEVSFKEKRSKKRQKHFMCFGPKQKVS